MKILLVSQQMYPFVTGGAEIFHYHLLIHLSKKADVGYIGFDNIKIENVNFYKIRKVKPWRFFTPLQTIFKLILLINQYNIVHLNYCQGSWIHWFYYPIMKKIFGLKYGMTIHDPSLYEWKHKKVFKWVFLKANFIVAVSERLKEEYEARCGREIIYLPPLIPLTRSPEQKSQLLLNKGLEYDSKVFLFAGSLKESKRPLIIIEAINLIEREWLNKNKIIFLFAGDGNLVNDVLSKIHEYQIEKYVRVVGRILQEELNIYYKLSSYYIIPSEHEGKSMSLIEAMFNKLPIIASNAPGINDIIFDKKNGLLFELDNPKHLTDQIRLLVSDDELSSSLADQAYVDYLQNFQFEEMLDKYIELYSS